MRFTAQEEYGLRCMVQMARHAPKGPLTISAMAKLERLTPAYVGKLLRVLRQGGLVEAAHGPGGGYRLPRPAEQISVSRVLDVLGGRLFEPKYCERFPGEQPFCVHTSECAIRSLWAGLDLIVSEILGRTSLADLSRSERTISAWIREQIPAVLEAAARAATVAPDAPGAALPIRQEALR